MDQILQMKGKDFPGKRSNYFHLQEIHFENKRIGKDIAGEQ